MRHLHTVTHCPTTFRKKEIGGILISGAKVWASEKPERRGEAFLKYCYIVNGENDELFGDSLGKICHILCDTI